MCADVHSEAFISCELYLGICVSLRGFNGRNISPIFCHKVARNLGLNYGCMHRLMIRRKRSLVWEENRCCGSCLGKPVIDEGFVGHHGPYPLISLRQQVPIFPHFWP